MKEIIIISIATKPDPENEITHIWEVHFKVKQVNGFKYEMDGKLHWPNLPFVEDIIKFIDTMTNEVKAPGKKMTRKK